MAILVIHTSKGDIERRHIGFCTHTHGFAFPLSILKPSAEMRSDPTTTAALSSSERLALATPSFLRQKKVDARRRVSRGCYGSHVTSGQGC